MFEPVHTFSTVQSGREIFAANRTMLPVSDFGDIQFPVFKQGFSHGRIKPVPNRRQ
jgi:hypothetical protein